MSSVWEILRVYRGGCWFVGPQNARVASRSYSTPDRRGDGLGLRLMRRCT